MHKFLLFLLIVTLFALPLTSLWLCEKSARRPLKNSILAVFGLRWQAERDTALTSRVPVLGHLDRKSAVGGRT
jgi:hypothetical protein